MKFKSLDVDFVQQQVHCLSLLYRHPKTEVYQFVIPDGSSLWQLLLEKAHCIPLAGHMGALKVILDLRLRVWWP